MFMRRAMLTVVGALCVMASSAFADPGAYELAMKKAVYEGYLKGMRKQGADATSYEKVADAIATCIASHSVEGFTPAELDQLNDWATGGPTPSADLTARSREKLLDRATASRCERDAPSQ
jgi:hypothetical protein